MEMVIANELITYFSIAWLTGLGFGFTVGYLMKQTNHFTP